MPDYDSPIQVPQSLVDDVATLKAASAQFVSPTTMTVADVASGATYAPAAGFRGKYIRVSDYAGSVDRVLRCDFDSESGTYFWAPTQSEFGRTIAMTGDMTVNLLTHPTSINFTGTIALGTTRTITLGVANPRPGAIVEFKAGLSSILGALNIVGTGLGSAVSVALGSYKKFFMDLSSGSPKWVQLV